jgi:hypothetical protein
MLSRSEGWGGLLKDEQYRLMKTASRAFILIQDWIVVLRLSVQFNLDSSLAAGAHAMSPTERNIERFKDAQPSNRSREAVPIHRYCSPLNRPPRSPNSGGEWAFLSNNS